jgi:crotonobetainyl-CoA:carnitine CoA-transferase CaiB-like acyl-CoA transferase
MTGPLEGVRILEVATWAYVPSTGAILADWGADVIKVESPAGDPMRGLTSGWALGKGGSLFACFNPTSTRPFNEAIGRADVAADTRFATSETRAA